MTDVVWGVDFVDDLQVAAVECLIDEAPDESPVLFCGHGIAPPSCRPAR
jgi:hypothetical protein